MRAACAFVHTLKQSALLSRTERVVVECYGSLGQTGKGHGTGKAIILGLAGFEPESVDIEAIPAFLDQVEHSQTLRLGVSNRASSLASAPSSSIGARPCPPIPTA